MHLPTLSGPSMAIVYTRICTFPESHPFSAHFVSFSMTQLPGHRYKMSSNQRLWTQDSIHFVSSSMYSRHLASLLCVLYALSVLAVATPTEFQVKRGSPTITTTPTITSTLTVTAPASTVTTASQCNGTASLQCCEEAVAVRLKASMSPASD
jgi:hypothetical protein